MSSTRPRSSTQQRAAQTHMREPPKSRASAERLSPRLMPARRTGLPWRTAGLAPDRRDRRRQSTVLTERQDFRVADGVDGVQASELVQDPPPQHSSGTATP